MSASREWPQRAAIVLATVVTFARAIPFRLQDSWDDGRFIAHNVDAQHVSWDALWRMFTQTQFEAYHPLHLLSYWLDVPWLGVNAWAIHATSLALWVAALLVVYALLRALEITAWAALAGTLLCGLHPIQVEAVSWATGRKDVLALLLSAASLLAHVRARSAWDRSAWSARALYVLAMLAKTTAVPLPLFALSLDVFARDLDWRRAFMRQLPSLLLGVIVSGFVVWLWGANSMLRSTVGGPELAPLRFVQTFGHQFLTALWPAQTSPMYATQPISTLRWGACAALAIYVAACVVAYRTQRGLLLSGLIGFVVLLLPAANVFPLYFPLQDRYLSLPLLALAIAATGLVRDASSPRFLVPAFALVGVLAARTWQYQGEWQSETRLWGHAASTQPDADYAWLKLGEVRRDAGDLEGAIAAYRVAIHVAPSRKLAHAALFEAVALRDERRAWIRPSLARGLAHQYYQALDQPQALRELADRLLQHGYLRSAELPLQLSLVYEPLPDALLEGAARAALNENRPSLARFYVHSMHQPPQRAPLQALGAQSYFAVLP